MVGELLLESPVTLREKKKQNAKSVNVVLQPFTIVTTFVSGGRWPLLEAERK